jgi:hypothetical protein
VTARETLVTTLTNLLAVARNGRMDAHHAEAERLVDEALKEHAHELARRQKAFFGDVSSQGNDGNWYGMSDWLTEVS